MLTFTIISDGLYYKYYSMNKYVENTKICVYIDKLNQ